MNCKLCGKKIKFNPIDPVAVCGCVFERGKERTMTDRELLKEIRDLILGTEDDPEELPIIILDMIEEHLDED